MLLRAWLSGLAGLALAQLVLAKSDAPDTSHTLFDNLPARLIYFEDTYIVLYHDAVSRNVWRSDDEGKGWKVVQGVPQGEAFSVVEHPFNSRMAFILSKGTTHYRSVNRGETWQSFEVEAPPAMASEILGFHSRNWDWVLYTGQHCESIGGWFGKTCYDETYYTQDAFASKPKKLLEDTSKCLWAHSTKEIALDVPKELVYCVAYETSSAAGSQGLLDKLEKLASSGGMRSITDSRLFSSKDFFQSEKTFVDMGIGKGARGVVGIGAVKGYIVAALKPGLFSGEAVGGSSGTRQTGSNGDDMLLYVSTDTTTWHKGLFPHGHGLRENAYTIVESTQHSILVDVLSDPSANSGTLFTSDSRGTNFVKSLEYTNRNAGGIVDFEKLESIDGIALANIVSNNDEVNGRSEGKKLKTKITFDDGGHWQFLVAPDKTADGKKVKCDTSNSNRCSLNLHSVTQLRNYGRVFSSTAPGIVMGVGSIGEYLQPYDECDTFVSTDAGQTWSMVKEGAHKYEFGAVGSILVMVDDEEATDKMHYSFDYGKTWSKFDFGVTVRAKLLTTIPDSTSQKFMLLGTLSRKSQQGDGGERHIIVHVDFESLQKRKCGDGDLEKWYARNINGQPDCLMGHKQWFMRRKQDADCVVADLFKEPVGRAEDCPCADEDFECDYNYTLDGSECVLAGPQPIPAGACEKEGDKFKGSSGYRLIPGNTCNRDRGLKKDAPKLKDCSEGQASGGKVTHQRFDFPAVITEHAYFGDSKTLLAYTSDNSVWLTMNEGFSWKRVLENEKFVASAMHAYSKDRAYLFTSTKTVYYTTDKGATWDKMTTPLEPNTLSIPLLDFHPTQPDWLIWTGSQDCSSSTSSSCRAISYYTKNHGRNWSKIDSYVRVCTWARDKRFKIDERTIFCESYSEKSGSQKTADSASLQLISGGHFYSSKKVLFDSIVGFATFEEYMVVAELTKGTGALTLRVSLDGKNFATGHFPPGMKLENQAYTVLESTTDAVFLHVTTHGNAGSEWGSLFKSNSNGTYYAMSLEHVNRNSKGYVDFEKMLGLDGIALMNVVSNPDDASISGSKALQTRITHNDGGRWVPVTPPAKDSLGQAYQCSGTACSLHIHGYTERADPRATFSSPTAVGLMLGVGNVGKDLAGYTDSDTFLTRDAGFTWEEVHKDAHIWEFGDQGSIIILVNDEQPTDRVVYTTNEGLSWDEYVFGDTVRIKSIVTVPTDTSRKFILVGYAPNKPDSTVAIHLDFTKLTNQKCRLDITDPNNDDFELWSPSEEREERCLFGRQTLYYRRIRDRNCYIGEKLPQPHSVQKNCLCTREDFECEFNHIRNAAGDCVLIEGAQALASDGVCAWNQEFWYERTAYRKVPHSSCEGGEALDQGKRHICPGASGHGFFWWAMVLTIPALLAGLIATWWSRRRAGRIRLGEPAGFDTGDGWVGTLQSIPFYIIGVASAAWAHISEMSIPWISDKLRSRRSGGYRAVLDDDAALLGDYGD